MPARFSRHSLDGVPGKIPSPAFEKASAQDFVSKRPLTSGGYTDVERPEPLALPLAPVCTSLGPASHGWTPLSPTNRIEPPTFSQAEIFLELNDTDGDLGLHASIDGDPWLDLEIEGPDERPLLASSVAAGCARTA